KHYYPDGKLAAELLAAYGSPLYVYDSEHLEEKMHEVDQSIPYPGTRFAFAAVTNGNINLLRKFKAAGWSLHANTPGDAFLGMKAGFEAVDIVYSGSNLTPQEMEQMLRWGIGTYNLDSLSQLDLLARIRNEIGAQQPKIGFRLNLPQITGESRIGISSDELIEAERRAIAYDLSVTGIHFYRGTSTNATERFIDCIDAVLSAGKKLKNWRYLDFGGGFGFAYFDRKHSFEWQLFGKELNAALRRDKLNLDLIIEPGRSIIAGSAALLCTVVSSKWQGEKQFLGVDTSTSNIAVLSVHGGVRQVRYYGHDNEPLHLTDVCGNTTYSRDYLAKSCSLPAMVPGDILSILDVGAYGYAMSSHFLHRPRIPELLIENAKPRLIRKRENIDSLLSNQVDFE
ncbi:MAG: hypothetical protein K2X81_16825, partial [Candidatus Obscuribacterales bacterium]|nr:hypothetical protein [Candidatus Obscuribacterales bacterium]